MEWWDSIAFEYKSKVLSPLYPGVKNPIFKLVEGLNSKDYERVADLGCGRGEFLGFLSQRFKEVWGIDWSKNMLHVARKMHKGNKNVYLKRLDIRNLESLYGYFDLAFSINTITPYDISVAEEMVEEIFKALRAGGLFVSIFPSFDTVLYQRGLTYTSYIECGLSPEEAWQRTEDYFVRQRRLDLEKGAYTSEDGTHIQKFFTENEIHSLLQNAGFREIVTEKVLYPWELSKKYGYGYFPNKPEIWDWFASARRP
ncbi:MAG: class I SAM-dependent methyltransferase [Dehalococcoidia bacterium]|nr:class I SAM-dependent methyltransferase [Dehalococcoidia bacterium]